MCGWHCRLRAESHPLRQNLDHANNDSRKNSGNADNHNLNGTLVAPIASLALVMGISRRQRDEALRRENGRSDFNRQTHARRTSRQGPHAISLGQQANWPEHWGSAFEMYEFHATQEETQIHPGQNFDLDYSLTQVFPLSEGMRLQLGLVGYGQWQTTDESGPVITPEQAAAHYKVNALGFATNLTLPDRKVNVDFKYFREFNCRSTVRGYSVQVSGMISF
jgi:hypothetical protein